ncbi:MAG: CHAT domain-containing protein [Chthoniobacterales bacterium]
MTNETLASINWTRDFIVVDGRKPAGEALREIEDTTARWIIVSREDGLFFYALTSSEIVSWPALRAHREGGSDWEKLAFQEVLDLRERDSSMKTVRRETLPSLGLKPRAALFPPSAFRYVEVGPDRIPQAIGADEEVRAAESRSVRGTVPPLKPPPLEDEGTTPVRYPSLDSDAPLAPGAEITMTIDLLRTPPDDTEGGPLSLGTLAPNWEALDLTVLLLSPEIDFENEGRGTITINRNAESSPSLIKGRVQAGIPKGRTTRIVASFFDRTRFCGSAFRSFIIGSASPNEPGSPPSPAKGTVVAEPGAARPDVTVHITTLEETSGRLQWLIMTDRFDGLQPRLRGEIVLEKQTDEKAAELFREFARLERGQHQRRLEGFGTRLWEMAPPFFREVYWTLWDHYGRRLRIQFISDEPHLPWELMRPTRADESETHPPLAHQHAVARWLEDWDGYMRNQLPAGRICTIAPNYQSVSRRLSRAQTEAEALVKDFGAEPVSGTRQAVLALLETAPSPSIAVLHFAGHGQFASNAADLSNITLEDGSLAASEVRRPEVTLGKTCRTLVFFNACEVGATGNVFGDVGGWADAFLARQFGGFIAPLWSVDDEDAGVVAKELLEGVVKRREPIGEVLRAIRVAHGDVSPTFYSYLYYGDVTARLGA